MPTEKWINETATVARKGLKTTDSAQRWYLKMLSEIEVG